MKRIIYLSNSVLPGKAANAVHVMKMCNGFASNFLNVTLLAKTWSGAVDLSSLFELFSVPPSFNIRLFKLRKVPGWSLLLSLIIFPIYVIRNRRETTLIYSRNRHASFILAMLRVAHCYELHAISGNRFQLWLDKAICRSNSVSKVVAISQILKDDIVTLMRVPKEKIIVAHDGADIIKIEMVEAASLKGDFSFNVGYVGSLLPGKGVDLLCKAAEEIPKVGIHIIGGSGSILSEYRNYNLNMSNVFFYGFIEQSLVPSYLKAFDVVVLPNKKSVITANGEDIGKYTSPLKLFEYIALQKKIIVSDLPVLKEIVVEGEVIFFESGSVVELVKAIRKAEIENLTVNNLYQRFLLHYTWEKRAKNIIEFYYEKV